MITQIEIDGFKTFKDFKVELAPFQVIVGPNGSGKSNLFDALHLLSRLADTDLLSAFQGLRGDAGELFTKLPDGQSVDRMRIAVEMLVDRKVQDELGEQAELKYTRLRYGLEITLQSDGHDPDRLHVAYESLKPISRNEDNWCKKYGLSSQNSWLPEFSSVREPFIDFIDTSPSRADSPNMVILDPPVIRLYSDGKGEYRNFRADKTQRTVLSAVNNVEHPHVFAAREELRSLRFLHLNPVELRKPSPTKSRGFLSEDGSNLPTTLARMRGEDKFTLTDVSRDMANLVPGILEIQVERDKASDEYVIYAETSDRRSFSSRVLSDGTLRLLALATLRNDPQFHGVLCIEEPENGVDPLRLEKMARLLHEMAIDFNDLEQVDEPLRQVLVTTHSPAFISQPEVIDSLLLAIMPTHVQGRHAASIRVTRMVPVIMAGTQSNLSADIDGDKAVEAYTIDQVRKYLDSDALDEARDQLRKARTSLSER